MPTDVIDRLRAADPAHDVDPHPPEDLLRALRATPHARKPPKPKRNRRRRALVLLPVVVAAAVAAFLVPGTKTDLAARAYAQTAPAGDEILYVHTTVTTAMRTPNLDRNARSVSERWQQGERWHARTDFDGRVVEETRGADGVLRSSDDETGTTDDDDDMKEYIVRRSAGFLAEFRANYERGTLDERGTATFAGRPARRYVAGKAQGRNRYEYFVDAETGRPLGSIERFAVFTAKRGADGRPQQGAGPNGTFTATTTVDTLKQLPPTPENLAKLAG